MAGKKMFVILLKSLEAGLNTAQGIHAFWMFTQAYPEKTAQWTPDNNVIVLEHENLEDLSKVLSEMGLDHVGFREPDRNDQLTAICAEPSARKHLAKLKLAA